MTTRAFFAAIATALAATTSLPAAQARSAPPADSTGRPALTAADLEVFLDGLVPQELVRNQVAGAVISVLKGGQLYA